MGLFIYSKNSQGSAFSQACRVFESGQKKQGLIVSSAPGLVLKVIQQRKPAIFKCDCQGGVLLADIPFPLNRRDDVTLILNCFCRHLCFILNTMNRLSCRLSSFCDDHRFSDSAGLPIISSAYFMKRVKFIACAAFYYFCSGREVIQSACVGEGLLTLLYR
ncbi:hypothetical protein CSA37_12160 [Candidatus Fermentibacteria bacterium]|nr:MAG: hypothetical protein CSA37_12160 [Candidatus Fermentibacteria bacterium]